jgi:hypothetical protein
MRREVASFYQKITSKGTWKQAWGMMGIHDPSQELRRFGRKDYLPLILVLVLTILVVGIVSAFLWFVTALFR